MTEKDADPARRIRGGLGRDPQPASGAGAQRKKWPFWVELPILILIAFGLTFLIQTFIAKVYYVPSGSMEQTLHGSSSGGDRILANKIVYDFRDPEPGDVIVFSGPPTWVPETVITGPTSWFGQALQALGSVVGIAPPNEKDYVKRVIAVGGQTVMCCDAEGNVMVDGTSLHEPYIYEPIEFMPGELDCSTVPDVAALLRAGDDPGGRALGDGRSPFGLRRLVLPVPGPASRRGARSARGRSRSRTSSARRSSS